MQFKRGWKLWGCKKEKSSLEKKMLIVYYSVSNGNTKRIAEQLQKATGADITRLETVTPYSGSY